MAGKRKLKARIAELEVEVAFLKAEVAHLTAEKEAGMFVQTGGEMAMLQLCDRILELEEQLMRSGK